MLEYARSRFTFFWVTAATLPHVHREHRDQSKDHYIGLPHIAQCDKTNPEKQGKGSCLDADGHERGNGCWRTFIGIGNPHVKGGGGNFETEADDDQEGPQGDQGTQLLAGQCSADVHKFRGPGHPVEKGHTIKK